MDYVLGERGDKCDQLQCEMHMAAAVDGHRKNQVGFSLCMNGLRECYFHFVCMHFLPAPEGTFGSAQRFTG